MKVLKYRTGNHIVTRLLPVDAQLLIGHLGDAEIYDGDIVDTVCDYDADGLMQEYPVSADLTVTFTDSRGKTYPVKENFKCAL